jgi:hypothetical protein
MRVFVGILLFIFIVLPMLCGMLFLAAINTWAFDRTFYNEILEDEAVYEGFIQEAQLQIQGTGTVFDELPDEAASAGLREVVTPQYLRTTTTQIVDQVFDVLEGRRNEIDISIDLQPVKNAITGEQRQNFAQAIAANLPNCRTGEQARNNAAEFPTCREGGLSDAELVNQIEAAAPALVATLPDTVRLPQPVGLFEFNNAPIDFPGINSVMIVALLTLSALALIFWFVNGILMGDTRRTRLIALGFMLLIPSAFVLFTGLAMGGGLWESSIRTAISQSTGTYTNALTDSVIDAAARVRAGFLIAGGIPFIISILLMVLGYTSPSGKRKREDDGIYVTVPSNRV